MVSNGRPQNGPGRLLLVVQEEKKSVTVIGPVHTGDGGRLRRWRGVSAGVRRVDNASRAAALAARDAHNGWSSTAEHRLSTGSFPM